MKANSQKQIPPRPPFVKGGIAANQIKAIHAVVGKLGLDDDAYREILMERYRAKSCKELDWRQAEELLESLNGKPSPSALSQRARGLKKHTDMDGRPGFASGAQCRLIEAMWSQVSRAPDGEDREKALNSFIKRIAGVDGLRFVKSWQVEKIVKAIDAMGAVKKVA